MIDYKTKSILTDKLAEVINVEKIEVKSLTSLFLNTLMFSAFISSKSIRCIYLFNIKNLCNLTRN